MVYKASFKLESRHRAVSFHDITDKVKAVCAESGLKDGLVVVYDDTAYAQTGSVTGHHATRAGFAFKWQDETAATVLERVEWS